MADASQLVEEFVVEYAKSLAWEETDIQQIYKKLSEKYHYGPTHYEEAHGFIKIAYGYFWAKTGCHIEANGIAGLLKYEIDLVYQTVCKENGWSDK